MKVGFTGTRSGMTEAQKTQLTFLLNVLDVAVFHHGDCVGADAEAHEIARDVPLFIVVHPPDDSSNRAWVGTGDRYIDPKPFLERNHDIVDASDVLIACPKEDHEVMRSGTWATIRYAKKQFKQIYVIHPDGKMTLMYSWEE